METDKAAYPIGSRVLVVWKGFSFRATIRKHRYKDECQVLIHFDGNKKTTANWVSLKTIEGMLEQSSTKRGSKDHVGMQILQDTTNTFPPARVSGRC